MRHTVLTLLCLAVSLALTGCGGTASPTRLTQTAGTLTATLTVTPYPPVPMQDTTLELTLQDAGQPVTGAMVRFDLTMPGMEMPPNHPEATYAGDGVYQAQALFTMAGEWQIRVEVTRAGESDEFTFSLRTK
jgi:nitrogen fixation protein FixH